MDVWSVSEGLSEEMVHTKHTKALWSHRKRPPWHTRLCIVHFPLIDKTAAVANVLSLEYGLLPHLSLDFTKISNAWIDNTLFYESLKAKTQLFSTCLVSFDQLSSPALWLSAQMDGWMDERTDGQMDGRTDGLMDGWTDGRMTCDMFHCE